MIETWKPVPLAGYESRYEVSNFGRVRTLQARPMILSPRTYHGGYLRANLAIGTHRKSVRVHRLVALAFIPNPEGKECINHKDNDPKNNRVNNLEWMTHQENRAYCVAQGRHAKGGRVKSWWSVRKGDTLSL